MSMAQPFDPASLRREIEEELRNDILPFWIRHLVDEVHGGFHGALTNDLRVKDEVPRSAVLCARILWTYAAARRRLGGEEYLAMARRAYDYLQEVFWDKEFGGLYWQVDRLGRPVAVRKHHYAQAFGIYGLAEYHRATGDREGLALAQRLFRLLEEHAHDPANGGYREASGRKWEPLADMRLSGRDPNCRKSMNTMLHILEAYTNLLRVWDDPLLRSRHRELLEAFLDRILDPRTGHLRLYFDDEWRSLSENVSYGHDIEGSWLLTEAAEIQADPEILARARAAAAALAGAVLREGLDADGSLFYEAGPGGLVDDGKAWWPQAEAVVGFYNACRITGEARFAEAAFRSWRYIRERMIDRTHGEWFKRLHRDGMPDHRVYKAGPWECPYHHSRACFEMGDRLGG